MRSVTVMPREVVFHGHPIVTVRPAAFKRCLGNLVSNAARFARSIAITGLPRSPLADGDGRRRRAGHSRIHA